MHTGSILLAVIGLLMLVSECLAFPYRPTADLSILSEYAASGDSDPPHSQTWKVVPEVGSDGACILRFFLETSDKAVTLCELTLPSPGAAGETRWKGMSQSGQKKSSAGILLVPGFPAPCDVLPVGQADRDDGGIYEDRIEAGGRVFLKRYRVSFEKVNVAEAKAMGWIRVEEAGKTGLIMVTVTDERGNPAVKQLWPVDAPWWLYEETPLRRSWLIR